MTSRYIPRIGIAIAVLLVLGGLYSLLPLRAVPVPIEVRVTLSATDECSIDAKIVDWAHAGKRLRSMNAPPACRILLDPDVNVQYEIVSAALQSIIAAGFTNSGFVAKTR